MLHAFAADFSFTAYAKNQGMRKGPLAKAGPSKVGFNDLLVRGWLLRTIRAVANAVPSIEWLMIVFQR